MNSPTKSPEQRRLERLARNPNEALGERLWGPRKTFSKTDVKDFGMHSRKIRRSR